MKPSSSLINDTLDDLVATCKRMVDEDDLQFREYMNEKDSSILHFLLASGDDVSGKQLRDDLMPMLIAGHGTSAGVLTWAFYLLAKTEVAIAMLIPRFDFQTALVAPTVGMTTGSMIHTTQGLSMTITRRNQPPVVPTLETSMLIDSSLKGPEATSVPGQQKVSPAHS